MTKKKLREIIVAHIKDLELTIDELKEHIKWTEEDEHDPQGDLEAGI